MSSSDPISEPAEQAGESVSVGSQLRLAREQAGLGVDELARRLCMTPDKLEALERDDFERLAGATYVRGYIRNTCKELGLDSAPVLQTFEQQMPAAAAVHVPEMPRGAVMARGEQGSGGALFGPAVLVLALVAAGGYWWFGLQQGNTSPAVDPAMTDVSSDNLFTTEAAPALAGEAARGDDILAAAPAEPGDVEVPVADLTETAAEVAPAQDATQAAEENTQPLAAAIEAASPEVAAEPEVVEPVATQAPSVADEPAAGAVGGVPAPGLSLAFSEESWVEVTDATGNKLLAKLQPAGSTVELTGEAPFSLMLGNAAATTVSYAGEVVDSKPIGNRRTRKLTVGG